MLQFNTCTFNIVPLDKGFVVFEEKALGFDKEAKFLRLKNSIPLMFAMTGFELVKLGIFTFSN